MFDLTVQIYGYIYLKVYIQMPFSRIKVRSICFFDKFIYHKTGIYLKFKIDHNSPIYGVIAKV